MQKLEHQIVANNNSNNIKIAVLVIVSLLIAIFGVSFLRGSSLFSNQNLFYSVFDRASGLEKANKVYLLGVEVGQVEDIQFINNFEQVKVSYTLKKDLQIPSDSKVSINPGIPGLGSPSLQLQLGQAMNYLPNASKIESIEPNSLTDQAAGIVDNIGPTVANLNKTLVSLDTAINNVNGLLSGQNGKNIEQAIANLSITMERFKNVSGKVDGILEDQDAKISAILTNVETISQTLASNQEAINNTIKNLSSTSENFSQIDMNGTMTSINSSVAQLNSILTKINTGEGSLSLLINDAELYNNLNNAARDLDLLLLDIKQQPDEFIPDVSLIGRKKK